ncbi:MAG TPA: hypothetical protein VFI46_10505 [Jiangellaceae bacterium]|nr:hypothetical protein [Jiangellaceae bacterium]
MTETVWDRINFEDVGVDFTYGALLPRFSDQRLLAVIKGLIAIEFA